MAGVKPRAFVRRLAEASRVINAVAVFLEQIANLLRQLVHITGWLVLLTSCVGLLGHPHLAPGRLLAPGAGTLAVLQSLIRSRQGSERPRRRAGLLPLLVTHPSRLPTLVHVAGTRWAIEEQFQAAKSQAGLDHYQVRTWTAWRRFITLAMLALVCLMACAAVAALASPADPWHHARHRRPIALTAAEIRRLFNGLITTPLQAQPATPPAPPGTPSTGPTCAASTKAKPAEATTGTDSSPHSAHK